MKHLSAFMYRDISNIVFLISTEGKGNIEKVQERVARIQQLREALREETLKNGVAMEKSDLCQQVTRFI